MSQEALVAPSIISNVKYSPPLSTNLDWVPEEKRLSIDIWRQINEDTWLLGDKTILSRRNTPWVLGIDNCLCTWGDSDNPALFYALLNAPSPLPSESRPIG